LDDFAAIVDNDAAHNPIAWRRIFLASSWNNITNVLAHAVVSALVTTVAFSLGASPNAAVLAGALFAVHPIHTEAVANGVGRAELLVCYWLRYYCNEDPYGPLTRSPTVRVPFLPMSLACWRKRTRSPSLSWSPSSTCASRMVGSRDYRGKFTDPLLSDAGPRPPGSRGAAGGRRGSECFPTRSCCRSRSTPSGVRSA
jgi:hypothetical protein